MASELSYGIIKYNEKKDTFVIIDKNRTIIYDSGVGFLDIKALNLKDELSNDEINKVFTYMKPPMIKTRDRNIINLDIYEFFFTKLLASKGIKMWHDVLTKEMVEASWLGFI